MPVQGRHDLTSHPVYGQSAGPALALISMVHGMSSWLTLGFGPAALKPIGLGLAAVLGLAFVMPDPVSLMSTASMVGAAIGLCYGMGRVVYVNKVTATEIEAKRKHAEADAEAVRIVARADAEAIGIVEKARKGSVVAELEKATAERVELSVRLNDVLARLERTERENAVTEEALRRMGDFLMAERAKLEVARWTTPTPNRTDPPS